MGREKVTMKKMTAAMLAALMLCAPALAMENLQGTALVGQDTLYYSGSLDGASQGAFVMDVSGANAQMLFAGAATLLAGNEESLLLQEFGADSGEGMVLLQRDGSELYRMGLAVNSAIESEGRYFAGPYMLWLEGGEGCQRAYVEVSEQQRWQIDPVWAEGDILYYLDSTRYAGVNVEGGTSVGKLMRLNLSTGESAQVSPEGTSFVGVWQGRAVYTRSDFYIYEGDDVRTVDAQAGLYREGESGGQEVLLAPTPQTSEGATTYARVMDGVVYGLAVDYSQDQPTAAVKRVTAQGEALADIPVPAGEIAGAGEGKLYLVASYFDEQGGFVQADQLIEVDVKSGQWTQINGERQEALCYSEAKPRVALAAGRLYYLDFDAPRSAVRLSSVNRDGSGYALLAQGYSWLNVEE